MPTKDTVVQTRLSSDEAAVILRAAKNRGLSPAAFMRDSLLRSAGDLFVGAWEVERGRFEAAKGYSSSECNPDLRLCLRAIRSEELAAEIYVPITTGENPVYEGPLSASSVSQRNFYRHWGDYDFVLRGSPNLWRPVCLLGLDSSVGGKRPVATLFLKLVEAEGTKRTKR